MFKRIRVVTGLIILLTVFCLLQIFSGGVFYHSLKQDQYHFGVYQDLRKQQTALSASWVDLIQTRNTLNRAAVRYLMDSNNIGSGATVKELLTDARGSLARSEKMFATFLAMPRIDGQDESNQQALKQHYDALHAALVELDIMLNDGKINAFFAQPTQGLQNNFETAYSRFLTVNTGLYNYAVDQNRQSYVQSIGVLGAALVMVLLLSLLAWIGIRGILLHPLNYLMSHIRGIAAGDLTQKLSIDSHNEMGMLAESLCEMQLSLTGTVHSVRQSAHSILSGASGIAAGNSDLSSRTEQQASALEQTAASMEELTATVKQNAENARQAKLLALSASETAQKGGKVVANVISTMTDIAGSSQKIADITGVIDGIAFQTNILALNAAVEAARAGEQGRGFAVVAGEVRSLAQRSAQAAKEIKALIENSVNRVEVGSTLVESAGETMSEIVTAVTRVTDIMGEISSASDEQSRGIDQVGEAVTEMDRTTQQNAALVQQAAHAASAMEKQAGLLTQAVSVFRLIMPTHSMVSPVVASSSPRLGQPAERAPDSTRANALTDNWDTF
ncbi:methyl-accepting chemotaxis protein [Acerihabitans sp. TG2]|uniref:methyl-accepting chemotaxis protein n=1 Tax=Acerihabitans sp. TG2 TaxID=3096008 RepID=UPI002B23AFF3|nr:methyl-accepting chemotaxis protein [Acerihabitans sp. TG2]MEA9392619.1 methyl-accepting chemotaxis protein [Acerihabitans sp. TG2]